jgi:hypothetical protein
MRQALTVFLALFFGLGPLTAVLPASDEARLPSCCRRNGLHHCAMAMPSAALEAGSSPSFSAPAHCPIFPALTAALLTAVYPAPASPIALAPRTKGIALASASPAAMLSNCGRALADRGPPAPSSC